MYVLKIRSEGPVYLVFKDLLELNEFIGRQGKMGVGGGEGGG